MEPRAITATSADISQAIALLEKAKPTSWDIGTRFKFAAAITLGGGLAYHFASDTGQFVPPISTPTNPGASTLIPTSSTFPSSSYTSKCRDTLDEWGCGLNEVLDNMSLEDWKALGYSVISICFSGTILMAGVGWIGYELQRVALVNCVTNPVDRATIETTCRGANISVNDHSNIYRLISRLKQAQAILNPPAPSPSCWSRLFSKPSRPDYAPLADNTDLEKGQYKPA